VIDLVSVLSAIGGSGLLIVGRDVWLARRTVKSSEKSEERSSAREPLIVESIMLGNTTKVAELFQVGINELEDAKRRLAEEFKETKDRLEQQVKELTEQAQKLKAESEDKDRRINELYAKLGQQQIELESLRRQLN